MSDGYTTAEGARVGVLMGSANDERQQEPHDGAAMGGFGFSLRYRPVPHFAFDVGLDFLGGVDYLGNERGECGQRRGRCIDDVPEGAHQPDDGDQQQPVAYELHVRASLCRS